MSNIILDKKIGESLSLGFLFNEAFDMSRLESVKVYIGSRLYEHTVIDHMIRCELKSTDTAKLGGIVPVSLWIDDSVIGVDKIPCGELKFSTTNATTSNDSVNTGYDVVVPIVINDQAITTGDIVYNYVQGAQGIQGEQGEQGEKGDKGDKGDPGLTTSDDLDGLITSDYDDTQTPQDTDLIVAQGKKKFSLLAIFNYIKSKLGISEAGNTNKFLNEVGSWVEHVQSGGSGGAPLYMSNLDSDIAGYKKLTGAPDAVEVLKTITADNGTVSGEAYLFDLPIGTNLLPAGNFDFGYWRSVSTIAGVSTKLIEIFIYNPNGSEQSIIEFESSEINDTTLSERIVSRVNSLSSTINPLGRYGVRSKFRTTHNAPVTLTYAVGGTRGWWNKTPLTLRHDDTRDKNGNLSFQHLDSTSEKTTPVNADSLGLWDSVTSSFKKLSISNLLTYLKLKFISNTDVDETEIEVGKAILSTTGAIVSSDNTYRLLKKNITVRGMYYVNTEKTNSNTFCHRYDSTYTVPIQKIIGVIKEGGYNGCIYLEPGYYAFCWTGVAGVISKNELILTYKTDVRKLFDIQRSSDVLRLWNFSLSGNATVNRDVVTIGSGGIANSAVLTNSFYCANWSVYGIFSSTLANPSFVIGRNDATYGTYVEIWNDSGVGKYAIYNDMVLAQNGTIGFNLRANAKYLVSFKLETGTTKVAKVLVIGDLNDKFEYTVPAAVNAYGNFFMSSKTGCTITDASISISDRYDLQNSKISVYGHSLVEADSLGVNRVLSFTNLLASKIGETKVISFGKGGERTSGLNNWITNTFIFTTNVRYAMLVIGGNDTDTYEGIKTSLQSIIAKLNSACIIPILFTIGPRSTTFNTVHQQVNSWIRANTYNYVDLEKVFLNADGSINPVLFMADGVHPTVAGHAAIFDRIRLDCPYIF